MHWPSRYQTYFVFLAVFYCVSSVQMPASIARDNIALGARYTYTPAARYQHTADRTDATKLTDGKFASGYFWTSRAETVGWVESGTIRIDIDLGTSSEVSQVTIDTARGDNAGVSFPSRVDMFASADGEHYAFLGDLLKGKDTSKGQYLVRKFESCDLQATARYLTLFIVPKGNYTFIDEIEVFGKKTSGSSSREYPLGKEALPSFQRGLISSAHQLSALYFMRRKLLADFKTPEEPYQGNSKLDSPDSLLRDGFFSDWSKADSDSLQKYKDELFTMHASFLGGRFGDRLIVWRGNPWSSFTPIDTPKKDELFKKEIQLDLMQGGTTSDAICLTNPGNDLQKYKLAFIESNRSGGSPKISLREAVPVFLADDTVKTDPLVPFSANEITLHGGESKQIWLTVSADSSPGSFDTKLLILSPDDGQTMAEIPIRMQVFPVAFPSSQELQVNAWSYLNWRPIKEIPKQAAQDLREHHINVFVLHPSQIPWPKYSTYPLGINFYEFDNVVKLHHGASRFLLYLEFRNAQLRILNGNADFLSSKWRGLFKKWISAWVAHMKSIGLGYEDFAFYPLDEPQNGTEAKIISDVAHILKEVDRNLRVYSTLDKVDRLDYQDFISLTRDVDLFQISELDLGKERERLLSAQGKTVWTYGAYGGKKADPIGGYRLQAWRAYKNGATGIGFWAYADTGPTGTAWNDLDGARPDFSVIYEGKDHIVSSKRWEAWREGVEDYELLRLAKVQLRDDRERKDFWRMVDDFLDNPNDYKRFQVTRRRLLELASRHLP